MFYFMAFWRGWALASMCDAVRHSGPRYSVVEISQAGRMMSQAGGMTRNSSEDSSITMVMLDPGDSGEASAQNAMLLLPSFPSASSVGAGTSELLKLPNVWNDCITDLNKAGKGAYGDVFKIKLLCPHHDVATTFAMKVMKTNPFNEQLIADEISALEEITNVVNDPKTQKNNEDMRPYVTRLVAGSQVADGHHLLVMPFFTDGEFKRAMNNQSGRSISEMYGFMLHIAKGVAVMHEAGWVHGDLKGENAMLSCDGNDSCHATVIDFGLACKIGMLRCSIRGTPIYMAPEVLRRGLDIKPNPKTDVWSLGIMLWEIRFGTVPTIGVDRKDTEHKVASFDLREKSVKGLESERSLEELLQGMLTNDETLRFDIHEVIARLTNMAPVKMRSIEKLTATDACDCLQSQCCWTPRKLSSGFSYGKNSHHMTSYGEQCRQEGMKVFSDKSNCRTCSSCWISCCETRHRWYKQQCKNGGSRTKMETSCSEAIQSQTLVEREVRTGEVL